MKLTNLSLAILVAVGVAACGGSGDNNTPVDPPKPKPNQPDNNNNNKPTPPDAGNHVVDPTGTQVVDDKDLTKQNTVGTLQYIRRDGSQYDRTLNPSQPASASPLLGTTLNDQNPSLTNIVHARQDIVRADGTPVKAQFTGSDNPVPLKADGTPIADSVAGLNSLQQENFKNVATLAYRYASNGTVDNNKDKHIDNGSDIAGANNVDSKGKIKGVVNEATVHYPYLVETSAGSGVFKRAGVVPGEKAKANDGSTFDPANLTDDEKNDSTYHTVTDTNTGGKTVATAITDAKGVTAVIDPYGFKKEEKGAGLTDPKNPKKYTSKDVKDNKDVYMYRGSTPGLLPSDKTRQTVTPTFAETNGTRYGKGLVWWTTPEFAFENEYTRTGTTSTLITQTDIDNGLWATNGLVRVGNSLSTLGQELNWNKDEKKWENHHNTTTRIFGRYHLAYAGTDDKNKGIHPVTMNTFKGAKSFVAEYEVENGGKAGKATLYSIGAEPASLKYVQYGRVSTQLDVDEGVKGYADNFIRNPYRNKNTDDSVDDYFYRGTNATTIEQMAALPSDQKATYQGHALMYGIDNDFHNAGKRNLPNAFAGKTDGLGLGNFVEATADFGTKRLQGNVYNEWLLDQTKSATTRDNLVAFQGNIVGNTVVGTADRTYLAGDDKATFKASFFGEKAEELGGSFNSVKDADKYGSAYGENDWGGVFGATRGGTSNTFQGDDSNNVYGNNQQNGQQP
ncbi:MAG: transferrin-binding protein-like solute binding protein [Cardiobacterium sp.]